MKLESGVTRSIIDEILLWISKEIKWEGKVPLLEVSLMNFILPISKEIKYEAKVVLLKVSLLNIILGISSEIKWKVKAFCYSKYHR